jgi:hypothetical protein
MEIVGTRMLSDGKTARQLFEEVMANPARNKFGFGEKLAIVNVDLQQAYTRIDRFKTAYETDPRQLEYVNTISRLARSAACRDLEPSGLYGLRCRRRRLGHAHQHARFAAEHQACSERHAFDERLEIGPDDLTYTKRMPRLLRNSAGELSSSGTRWTRWW